MEKAERPIGIFDSGIGGLTVANAVLKALPNEDILYFGDTAHMPYGEKSPDIIIRYSTVITHFLLDKGVKLIIIACNSASSVAYKTVKNLANKRGVTVVNVILPVVDFILHEKYKRVGVIGTNATINSQVFPNKIKQKNSKLQIQTLATPLLAPMIESGFVNGEISKVIIENYLSDEALDDIESLVLACTHYPLIKNEIGNFYKENKRNVDILATNEIVAAYVKNILTREELLNTNQEEKERHFFVSDYTDSFEKTTHLFYKSKVNLQQSNIFE
ncbi:MAG: glutamate racemase [Chitinophagales bacterium]|nr:glutamate racemase [Chitinophagales bacterium]